MALTLKDRVLETASAPGTGSVSLLGAVTGYQSFSSAIGNANTCYYTIADQSGANWECGIGTYTSSGNTLARTTVLSSSNGGSLTNFASGTQNVFVTYPSEKAVYLDASGNVQPSLGTATFSSITDSGLTAGRVNYNGTGGLLVDSANLTFNGTTLTANTLNLTNALGVSYGGTGLTTLTSGYIPYGNGTSAFSSSSNLYFSGSNLGIGTSSPSATLHIVSAASTVYTIFDAPTAGYCLSSYKYAGTQYGAIGQGASVITGGGTTNFGIASNNSLLFGINGTTEAMRIDSSGNLLVGTTSQARSGDRLSVYGSGTQIATFQQSTNTSGYSAISTIIQSNGNNTSTYHFWGNTSGVGNWYLYGNGTTSFSSDERLKKNITTARNGYIDDLCKLRVVKYNWKKDAEGTPQELGLIAQEVEQVFPALVQDDLNPIEENGEIYKQVKQSVLPFMLLKAIQEQQAIIEQLKAKVGL